MTYLRCLWAGNFSKMTFGGEFMATLRYKNPTTQKWELVGVSGGGGGSSPATSNVIFRDKADFPTQGDTNCLYIATDENVLYRWNGTLNKYVQLDDTANINEIIGNI